MTICSKLLDRLMHATVHPTIQVLPANIQVSFIHAGKVNESDQLGLSIEVDPVGLVFLKLTLSMTTFPSPLVARQRHQLPT